MTAGEIMDSSAALLNDVAKETYGYTEQLPFLKLALKELMSELQLANIGVTNETSAVINVPAGTTEIGYNTSPALPVDLIDIRNLWERAEGIAPFVLMTKREFIPHNLESTLVSAFQIFSLNGNSIQLLEANRDNDIKIDYLRSLFTSVTDQNSELGIISGDLFLSYKNAALCAHFIGENKTRSDELNAHAGYALERDFGINAKSKQGVATRRRPFRSSYKSRAW